MNIEGVGQERVVTRFALYPVRLDDRTWCWLRRYQAREVFEPDYGGYATGYWVERGATRRSERTA